MNAGFSSLDKTGGITCILLPVVDQAHHSDEISLKSWKQRLVIL